MAMFGDAGSRARFRALLSPVIVVLAMQAGAALAQSVIPPSANPDLLERQFQPPEQPLSGGEEITTPQKESVEAPPGAEAATFTLNSVVIEGATAFAPADFLPLYQDRLGTRVSVKELYDLAQAITAKYTAAGYVLSQAVVPPQKINGDGIARIRVIEGFVDKVIIEGEVKGPVDLLKAYGAKISADRPLRLKTLERYLLLASDLPGAAASGTLRPSETIPGAADLVFEMHHKSVDAVGSLDNRGSRFLGPWQATAGVTLNSVLGLYERTSLLYAATPLQPQEMKYLHAQHDEEVGSEGTKLSVDAGYTAAHPGFTLKDAAVRSYGHVVGLGASHPLIRSRAENLILRGRFDFRDSETDQDVTTTVSEDRLRSLRLGGSYDWVDTWTSVPAVTLVSLELSKGLDILGARPTGSPLLSVANGHSDYVKTTVEATRNQRLAENFNLLVGISGQWAPLSLLAAEQFALGGSQYGRAYDPAEVTGDSGIAGKLELQYMGPEIPVVRDWQIYAFWDGGRTWLANAPAGTSPAHDLVSAGFGVRSNLNDWTALNAELAVPLTHSVAALGDNNGKDVRGFMGLVVRY
ncbi:MAG TPA: ShlB/FhaC/HecB family hemolysin secretion/activation protein [Magnetospirillum sp.]|jgi:hemolysin activation/secretion protein|nr:ShlB/FhaC/HecB family hemolysin secretion/activation protein [Magnetospirillum sp.]